MPNRSQKHLQTNKDVERAISNIFRSNNLPVLADNLERFLISLSANANQYNGLYWFEQAMMKKIYRDRGVSNPSENKDVFALFGKRNAILLFLDLYLKFGRPGAESIKNIEALIAYVHRNLREPQIPIISGEKIADILCHIENRYSFVSKVFNGRAIRIGVLDNMDISLNSFYLVKIQFGLLISDAIFLTHPIPDFGCTQEHTFLHELGHALHTRMTMSTVEMPVSFMELCDAILVKEFENPSDKAEVFADLFALAASIGTSLESSNPFSWIDKELKDVISQYFHLLLWTYEKNPYGKLTLEQMTSVCSKKGS